MTRWSKAEIQDLSCRDNDDAVMYLQKCEVGDVRMMVHYQSHLREKDLLPEDMYTFRFNSTASKDCVSFAKYLADASLVSSTCDMTDTPPANTGLADNFKISSSLADYLKKSFKRDDFFYYL